MHDSCDANYRGISIRRRNVYVFRAISAAEAGVINAAGKLISIAVSMTYRRKKAPVRREYLPLIRFVNHCGEWLTRKGYNTEDDLSTLKMRGLQK